MICLGFFSGDTLNKTKKSGEISAVSKTYIKDLIKKKVVDSREELEGLLLSFLVPASAFLRIS